MSAKQPWVYLSRKASISAAHRLHNPHLSDEENKNLYGKCNNPHGHGHNYDITVTLYGPVNPETGMVMNLCELDTHMKQSVLNVLDHKHIDLDIDYFKDRISSVENVTIFVWKSLKDVLPKPELLHEIRVDETGKNYACYRGE